MLLKPRLIMAAAALVASAAAFAQTPPPAPTITPITIAGPKLVQVYTKTANGRTISAYTGPGKINPDSATPADAAITVTIETVVNANGTGVINGGINVINKTTGQLISGRLIGLTKADSNMIMVEGAMRARMTTMWDRSTATPPLMLRGLLHEAPTTITINGVDKPALELGFEGLTLTLPTTTTSTGGMTGGGMM